MAGTSIEDFQEYHNRPPVRDVDETLHSSPQTHEQAKGNIQRDLDDDNVSASGSARHSSGPDEAVFDHSSRASSPRTSNGSDDDISVLKSHCELPPHTTPPFTPLKTRSPFRHTSSVRAMQMDITPPHLTSPSSQQRHKLYTPSRQCTPRSTRSQRSAMSSPSKLNPTKRIKKEYPLVLLHVTLLPIPLVYSQEIMESVLPPSILENWKLLQEKATDTVLERGILIPHPKEDYDLLEERLLESLELKIPRILKCGHFHLSPEEEADVLAESDHEEDLDDADICLDCGRRIRDGRYGSAGTGSKRWDIKLFAANGLMRAGAWSAAWREMERVDVEILPWMEEDMKRELELRREEEDRAKVEAREEGVGGLDDERLREIYGGDSQAYVDGLVDTSHFHAPTTPQRTPQKASRLRQEDEPLWDLFRDYIYHAAQDRRNVAIFLLSILVMFLSMGSFSSNRPLQRSKDHHISSTLQVSDVGMGAMSMASASTSAASVEAPSSSPSSEPELVQSEESGKEQEQEQEREQEQESSWTEAAEDVLSEMVED
jgi:hypothetical protein